MKGDVMTECGKRCEVFSRVVGYFRPVNRWNEGKQEEFRDRVAFTEEKALKKDPVC
jgi:anaerobic ribonucleoside-triphosphate reductase